MIIACPGSGRGNKRRIRMEKMTVRRSPQEQLVMHHRDPRLRWAFAAVNSGSVSRASFGTLAGFA